MTSPDTRQAIESAIKALEPFDITPENWPHKEFPTNAGHDAVHASKAELEAVLANWGNVGQGITAVLHERPELAELIKRSVEAYDAMTPEQKAEHDRLQRESWVTVPKVPTVEMIIAGTEEWLCIAAMEDRAEVIWNAMLAAAPQPKETEG